MADNDTEAAENKLIAMLAESCRAMMGNDEARAGYILLASASFLLAEADEDADCAAQTLRENMVNAKAGIKEAMEGQG